MAYQRGSLKKLPRKGGETWVLRFRVATSTEGASNTFCRSDSFGISRRRKPHGAKSTALAFRSASMTIPRTAASGLTSLAEHYLRTDFGPDAVRPKSERTTLNTQQIVRKHLLPRWARISRMTSNPSTSSAGSNRCTRIRELAWTTVSKVRGIMVRIYKTGILHELVTKNPVEVVETRSTTRSTGPSSSLRCKPGQS